MAAAILSGGRARRLGGTDKSALTVGGIPILQRILLAVRGHATHVFAVGDTYGAAARAGLPVVQDEIADAGALGGIYTALRASPCERTLVIACDLPFVTSAFIDRLVTAQEADVVIARDARGYQPLCAVYRRTCAEPIRGRLERGERQATTLPAGLRVHEIGVGELAQLDPEGLLFLNVNTPHDYERARRIVDAGERPHD